MEVTHKGQVIYSGFVSKNWLYRYIVHIHNLRLDLCWKLQQPNAVSTNFSLVVYFNGQIDFFCK